MPTLPSASRWRAGGALLPRTNGSFVDKHGGHFRGSHINASNFLALRFPLCANKADIVDRGNLYLCQMFFLARFVIGNKGFSRTCSTGPLPQLVCGDQSGRGCGGKLDSPKQLYPVTLSKVLERKGQT